MTGISATSMTGVSLCNNCSCSGQNNVCPCAIGLLAQWFAWRLMSLTRNNVLLLGQWGAR
jgi:hypothetical protein